MKETDITMNATPVTLGSEAAVRLSIISITTQPSIATTDSPVSFGIPIMGDGFITTTGIDLPHIA